MTDMKVGSKLPEDLIDTVPEGISGSFTDRLLFILKMEDLTQADIEVFKSGNIGLDLLELKMFNDKVGNIYAFSILVDGFIDNSEVLVDFRCEDLESRMPKFFSMTEGLNCDIVLCDEEDNILAIRAFKLSSGLSRVVSEKAFEQNDFKATNEDKDTDYILMAFENLFENEPEKNLELYSIGRDIVM